MYKIEYNQKTKIVNEIKFEKEVTFHKENYDFRSVNHLEIAKNWIGKDVQSIIIFCDPMDASLYNDVNHCYQENFICISQVEEEARNLFEQYSKYKYINDLRELIEEKKWPLRRYNYKEEEHPKFKTQLEDKLFELEQLKFIRLAEIKLLNECKYDYDYETEEERLVLGEELKKRREEKKREIYLPRIYTSYDRIFHMPKPLNWWDEKNPWQQWFFLDNGEKIEYIHGGGGSSQRENHGRFAHVCGTLQKQGQDISTLILLYDKDNVLRFVKKLDTFKAMCQHISGNYAVDYGEAKEYLKGMLIDFERTEDRLFNSSYDVD